MSERFQHYDTSRLKREVENLVASEFTEKDLEILRQKLPVNSQEVRDIDDFLAWAKREERVSSMLKLSWDGLTSTPWGLKVGGVEVASGRWGGLYNKRGGKIKGVEYVRLVDDRENKRQEMIILSSLPKDPGQPEVSL